MSNPPLLGTRSQAEGVCCLSSVHRVMCADFAAGRRNELVNIWCLCVLQTIRFEAAQLLVCSRLVATPLTEFGCFLANL